MGVIDQVSERAAARGKPSPAKTWLKAIELTSRIEKEPSRLFLDVVEDHAAASPDNPALISDQSSLSYRALTLRARRYARWALAVGLGKGDTVCLLMPAGPDYLAAWIGISAVGGVVALINTRLVGPSLAHCIDVARPRYVIVSDALAETLEAARTRLASAPKIWRAGELEPVLQSMDAGFLTSAERRGVTIDDRALLIYTSGTTGLPKAASISHRRIMNWSGWFAGLTHAMPHDRLYDCLPLYHSVGGVVAPCSMLTAGASVVLADRFSATRFWDDIVRHDCTIFQYIGELCRYLLNAPPAVAERSHRLRLACGNGLRGEVWEPFQARFAIPQILEFYAATEGNFSLYNVEGRPGAIGRVPPMLVHRFPAAIVRLDEGLETPARGDDGLCIRCGVGEVGEAIGRIGSAEEGGGRFEGYTEASDTERKILRNVLAEGDAWFRTGDLMRLDEQGFFHFVDRLGDTFRWKGENVATSEVNEAVLDCAGIADATTYGVKVPGADGRAGMTAVVPGAGFDIDQVADRLALRLPAYAIPVFLRITDTLDATETFKQKKQQLMREGFDPATVTDPLFVRDPQSGRYRPLDPAIWLDISNGTLRL